jgi:nitrous-oxide reductase
VIDHKEIEMSATNLFERVRRAPWSLTIMLVAAGSILVSSGWDTIASYAASPTGVRRTVHPGELDDYYAFFSGGHSGEVRIVGIPSMRVVRRIPVFNFDSGSGWGVTNESKALLKGTIVGDTHHVHGSYVNGTYDGKYLWVNDKANNRVARIRTDYMEVDAMIDIPHAQGTHGLFPQRAPQTDWIVCNTEFRTPIRPGSSPTDKTTYNGVHTVIDAHSMEIVCQVMTPTNLDLAGTDYGGKYSFATSYNSEGGVTLSEMLAKDTDYLVVFNWDRIKKALKDGLYEMLDGVKVLDGSPGSGLTIYIPIPKNPHGVNVSPDGRYAIASGKVSPTASIIDISKFDQAFAGKIRPIDCVVGQPEIGLGPLHTTFDGRGNAYTSLFIDSQIVKWNIQKAIDGYGKPDAPSPVLDRLDIHYQVGHTMASMAETNEADGKYLISLNKISKDRFINVGPLKPENDQLVDISGDKMVLLEDEPSYVEPHDCIIVRRDIIEPHVKHRYRMDEHPLYTTENSIERDGNKVTVRLTANAPVYGLQEVTVNRGDEVTFIVTNNDEIPDLSHGFCISEYNINFVVSPFQTKSVTFTADKPGLFWIYCTNFCHALHLEMRMRFIVNA